jgi:LPS sulfotransferase NodH
LDGASKLLPMQYSAGPSKMLSQPESPNVSAAPADSPRGPKRTTYGNFRDPVGLVMRMLRSRDRAARSALLRAAAEFVAAPFDWLLRPLEARRLARANAPLLPMFLVVGLPRSGTTLVYQTLAGCLPFSYFNNLSSLFPRSLITVTSWWRGSFDAPRDSTSSYYGHTSGMRGVNEGLHVWNRWLGEDRNTAPRQLDPAAVGDMRRFFAAWSQAFGRPLLNKSNRNTFCIQPLAAALPTAVFIVVRRDPIYVAQSLLQARKTVQGDWSVGWGLGAQREGRSPSTDPMADVVDQVQYCDEQLRAQAKNLPPERVIEIQYEDFCRDPEAHVLAVWERVRAACPAAMTLDAPATAGLKPLKDTDFATLDESQFQHLSDLMDLVEHPRTVPGPLR